MAKKKTEDAFSNVAYGQVTASAANVLTFSEIATGISVMEKIAWIVHRIVWYMSAATLAELTTTGDILDMALTLSNKVTDLTDLSDPAIVDNFRLRAEQRGTAASFVLLQEPWVRDFTSLPGGGLMVPPKPIYVANKSLGSGTASVTSCRIYFTTKTLAVDEFWDLVQAARIIE